MIAFASDCLLFETTSGESLPVSPETISLELMGENARLLGDDFVRQAARAVFYYFKIELGRKKVTVAEFAEALERVLRNFTPLTRKPGSAGAPPTPELVPPVLEHRVLEYDLRLLACESREGGELAFFPRLREELRRQLRETPDVLRLHGLRDCVKELTGARKWGLRCRTLHEQVVAYLRECLRAEGRSETISVVVD